MIKKTIMLSLFSASLFAGNIEWHTLSDMNADFKNKSITKPVILFVGDSNCQYCVKELSDMENDPKYVELVNNSYYNVHVNQDMEADNLPVQYTSDITPTIYLLNPEDLNPLTPEPTIGAVDINIMYSYLNSVNNAYNVYLDQLKKNQE